MKTHLSDGFSFANSFTHSLMKLLAILKQYEKYVDYPYSKSNS